MAVGFHASLARIIHGGPFELVEVLDRVHQALPDSASLRWVSPFVERFFAQYPENRPRPRIAEIHQFIRSDRILRKDLKRLKPRPKLDRSGVRRFAPVRRSFERWDLPEILTTNQLCLWLGVTPSQFTWLSSPCDDEHLSNRVHRYRYTWIKQSRGKARLIENPQAVLKSVQRTILEEILNRVPAHEAAHGFRTGRSVLTYAEPHAGQSVVWRTDLANCFPSIICPRIAGLFRMLGYPDKVADVLAQLCTNRVPRIVLEEIRGSIGRDLMAEYDRILPSAHLPQGAPTSPALLNLICFHVDQRLTGLASQFGAHYTRYADDLAFSGDDRFKQNLTGFRRFALAIIRSEGFAIRRHKSKVMTASRRQQLAGVVVNERPNVVRSEYKKLKAILHNCRVTGPEPQNCDGHPDFQSHLRGMIAHVALLHPGRGQKLLEIFRDIVW